MSDRQATLIVHDEVNCRFDKLDLETRRFLKKKMGVFLPHAKHTPTYKTGRWDGWIRFFSAAGVTYVNLLEEIMPELAERGYSVVMVDNRKEFNFSIPDVGPDFFAGRKWPKGHTNAGEPIVLRDYQVDVANAFLTSTSAVQVVATGAGKTLVTAALSASVEKAYPEAGRTVVIVPSKNLVEQTLADYLNLGLDAGPFYGDSKEWGRKHTICTWQSLGALWSGGRAKGSVAKAAQAEEGRKRMQEFIEGVTAVIVDECHQAKAAVLKNMLTKPFAQVPIRWGLTGTLPKNRDGQLNILSSIGKSVGRMSAKKLQRKKVLAECDVTVYQLRDRVYFKNYKKEAAHLLTMKDRVLYISKIVDAVSDGGNTLVLVDRIATGEMIRDALPQDRVSLITGKMKSADRRKKYDEIKDSDDRIMVATYGVASVGVNMVRLHNLVMVEPGQSFVRVIQSIGRALRKGKGKTHANVYDICSTAQFSARHLKERLKYYKEMQYPCTTLTVHWFDGE